VAKTAVLIMLWVVTAIVAPAQTFTSLFSFDGTDGSQPSGGLVQAANGSLYGTTKIGANGAGSVFKISPDDALTSLLNFDLSDGDQPNAALIQAANGNLYGTTTYGGASVEGSIFKMTLAGTLTSVLTFDFDDGEHPYAGLIQAADGDFYGTAAYGGNEGYGTVFKMTSGGTPTTLHSFDSTDGATPFGALVQATDGDFYGTTEYGDGYGTIFKITSGGTLTTLHGFVGSDGAFPEAGLVQAIDGNFYGTTFEGGSSTACSFGCGTVFKITPAGTLTTLHSFGNSDGAFPSAALIQATDGNFYGTTSSGGSSTACSVGGTPGPCGTVFKITPGGTLTTLHSFDYTDGSFPNAGLIQDTNGKFYGTAVDGGLSGDGTVFSLSIGLGPFVSFVRNPANVGQEIGILGQGLTGATSVSFNGIAASFKVESDTLLIATVPAGATTGNVTLTTPSGTLTSNVPFYVIP
jgi:uncharacterized repeat protein (TIGR03803 family)